MTLRGIGSATMGAMTHRAPIRVLIARVVVNALALAITVLLLAGIHENADQPVLGYLILGALFGVLNAFVKPALQFVALPFFLGSMGLIVIVIDVFIFGLLNELTPQLLTSDGVLWTILAGTLLGLLSFVFENVFGLVAPILSDEVGGGTAA